MADEETRNMIRKEQLKVAAELNNNTFTTSTDNKVVDESMLTPYGPPSPYAYIVPVPNDCIGLIIGKKGETIKRLQADSGAKIQVAKKEVAETNQRYVFVEGTDEKYNLAKRLIDEVVEEWRRIHQRNDSQGGFGDPNLYPMTSNLVGPVQDDGILDRNINNINHNTYNQIYPANGVENTTDPSFQAALSYQPYPGFRHPGDGNPEPTSSAQAQEAYGPYADPALNPMGYSGYHSGHHHPSHYPENQPHPSRPSHSGKPSDQKSQEESSKAPEETSGAGSNPANPHSTGGDGKDPQAHQYAEHYSKTLGGDYKYYYDYYMSTYSGQKNAHSNSDKK